MSLKYNVLDIIRGTTVDGPGFRTSIYLAGCSHHCEGCHNPQSWDPAAGTIMTLEDIMRIIDEEDFDVTISGGDPLYDPYKLSVLIQRIKRNRRNVWVYTGYSWEEIVADQKLFQCIREVDVLVDGLFIKELFDPDLIFKGSSNQRIIDVEKSLESKKIFIYKKE